MVIDCEIIVSAGMPIPDTPFLYKCLLFMSYEDMLYYFCLFKFLYMFFF